MKRKQIKNSNDVNLQFSNDKCCNIGYLQPCQENRVSLYGHAKIMYTHIRIHILVAMYHQLRISLCKHFQKLSFTGKDNIVSFSKGDNCIPELYFSRINFFSYGKHCVKYNMNAVKDTFGLRKHEEFDLNNQQKMYLDSANTLL